MGSTAVARYAGTRHANSATGLAPINIAVLPWTEQTKHKVKLHLHLFPLTNALVGQIIWINQPKRKVRVM